MGLFSFSQYGLLNKSQRPRLQRARSHRCHRQPPDSACAHGNPPRPLNATDSRRAAPARKAPSLALRIVLKPPRRHRSKFRPVLQLFCFYEAILRDKTNFQRLDRRNGAPRKARIATTSSEPRLFQRCAFGRLFASRCSMVRARMPVAATDKSLST